MDKRGAISLVVDLFEVYNQLGWIVFSICEDFGAKEGNDMIRDDFDGLVAEVRVIDTEMCIEPLHLVSDEFTGDEPLRHAGKKRNIEPILTPP
jgi:hypothetical protein